MPPLTTATSSRDEAPAANDDDGGLVVRALGGEREAFNRLVLRYEARLFRFLSRACPNAADVEDAMQRAFVKAYRKLATYDSRYRFTTWLFTIAVRELRSMRRKSTVAAGPLMEDHDPPAPATPDHAPGDLWAAAKRLLTATQYTAMWLRYGEDLAVRDVARVMGRPRVSVSVTLHRACAALRAAVAVPEDARQFNLGAAGDRSNNNSGRSPRGVLP